MVNIEIASIQVLTERREDIFKALAESRKMSKKQMDTLAKEFCRIEVRLLELGIDVLGHEK